MEGPFLEPHFFSHHLAAFSFSRRLAIQPSPLWPFSLQLARNAMMASWEHAPQIWPWLKVNVQWNSLSEPIQFVEPASLGSQ